MCHHRLFVQLKPLNLCFNPLKYFGTAEVSEMVKPHTKGLLAVFTTIWKLFGLLTR